MDHNCFRVGTMPFAQLGYEDQRPIVAGLQGLVNQLGDFRLWTHVQQLDLGERWLAERASIAREAQADWQKRGFQEEIWLGRQIGKQAGLKGVCSYLWLPEIRPLLGDLAGWGLEAAVEKPPPVLQGRYEAGLGVLKPVYSHQGRWRPDHTRPFATILSSYALKDGWDWYQPLGRVVLEAAGNLIVCVDGQRISERKLEMSVASHKAQLLAWSEVGGRGSHREAQQLAATAQELQEAVGQGLALHNVRLLFLLLDENEERLQARKKGLIGRLRGRIGVDELVGYQAQALGYFRPERRVSSLPQTHHNVLSPGTARMLALIGYGSEENYKGMFLGVGQGLMRKQLTGLSYLNLWEGRRGAHMLVLGETGYGKTVLAHALVARQVESGAQAIVLEPQGHCGRHLRPYFGDHLADYNRIKLDDVRVNPLDVVATTFTEQCDYFIALVELLLNPRGKGEGRPQRYLSNGEVAAVQAGLRLTYAGLDWESLLSGQGTTPQLDTFCHYLENVAEGAAVAQELRQLYVDGVWGEIFNGQSNLNTRLRRPDGSLWPVVMYDLQGVGEEWRPLFYFMILAGINREVRRPLATGEQRSKRVVVIDEFRYLSSGFSALNEWVANQVATARTFSTAFVILDQNPVTFLGEGQGHTARTHLLENMSYLVSFRLRQSAIARLREVYPMLRGSHERYLLRAAVGDSLVIDRDMRLRLVRIALRGRERKWFMGS